MSLRLGQRLVLVLGLIVLIGACASPPAVVPTAPAAASPPAELQGTPPPLVIPTPTSDSAVVYGTLLAADTKRPLSSTVDGVDAFLAKILRGAEPGLTMSSLDKKLDPASAVTLDGKFVFAKVPPGEYVLLIAAPMTDIVARAADNLQVDKVFTLTAGQSLDLGTMVIEYKTP